MAKKRALKHISEVVTVSDQMPEISKPEDYEGTNLVLINFKLIKGKLGDYYHLECGLLDQENPGDVPEQTFLISTSSFPVRNALEALDPNRDLPIVFQFVRSGRSWTMQ